MDPFRLFHTIRWLKPGQIVGQVRHRLRRLLPFPTRKTVAFSLGGASVGWDPQRDALGIGLPPHDPHMVAAGTISLLNHPETVGFPPVWQVTSFPKLWLYNLHYFEYLWSLPFEDSRRVALDWIENHPPGQRQLGWEAYPLSLRLQNWCGYFLGQNPEKTSADGDFMDRLVASIAQQAAFLERNLEYHLLGNHLFENAAALFTVGSCLETPGAEAWLSTGRELLKEQLHDQVLPDGGHFERSPMYQARLIYVLGQLVASKSAGIEQVVGGAYKAMKDSLELQTHPDGGIALLNDSAFGVTPVPADLGIRRPSIGPFAMSDTGYFGSRTRDDDYIICDAAPIGPDHLPGHAHGDIFSFELSLGGSRVVVDSGVFNYEPDEMRAYCRSTRAHNTVEIGGADQCEFWGAFRVARRGRPKKVTFTPSSRGFRLSGQHDGYRRLSGLPVHRRVFVWHDSGVLIVNDRVESRKPVETASRVHLHPDCQVSDLTDLVAKIRYPSGEFVVAWKGDGRLETEDSWYCPEFGVREKNVALVFRAPAPAVTAFCIARDLDGISFQA